MEWKNSDLFCPGLPTRPKPEIGKILVTGATGYIGGRLVPELLTRGYSVRIMVREFSSEHKQRWPEAEIVEADALDLGSLKKALKGINTAYYLIHSLLLGQTRFESADIEAAVNFRKAAEERDLKRIIYLGGLGDTQTTLSPHLRSRMNVAEELKQGRVSTTLLRAAIIIGSGSASYEIIEHLVRNCPFFLIPHWATTKCQPISVRDVIKYLVGVLETDETAGKSYDIGGKDILTYEMMLKILAGIIGKKRLFLPSPFSTVKVYAYIASLLTPVAAPITRCLMESIHHDVVCQNDDIKHIIPFQPITYKESVLRALSREEQDKVHTRWSDAYPPAHELAIKLHELSPPPRYTSSYAIITDKKASLLFNSICRIGGKEGWFNSNWMWRLRGAFDRIMMGVGTARGRRSASSLRVNDVIDFWRVEDLKQDEMLLLRAEMKLPGRGWLRFSIDSRNGENCLSVKAFFQPRGLLGKIYWYAFLPSHIFIFYDLIKQIDKRST